AGQLGAVRLAACPRDDRLRAGRHRVRPAGAQRGGGAGDGGAAVHPAGVHLRGLVLAVGAAPGGAGARRAVPDEVAGAGPARRLPDRSRCRAGRQLRADPHRAGPRAVVRGRVGHHAGPVPVAAGTARLTGLSSNRRTSGRSQPVSSAALPPAPAGGGPRPVAVRGRRAEQVALGLRRTPGLFGPASVTPASAAASEMAGWSCSPSGLAHRLCRVPLAGAECALPGLIHGVGRAADKVTGTARAMSCEVAVKNVPGPFGGGGLAADPSCRGGYPFSPSYPIPDGLRTGYSSVTRVSRYGRVVCLRGTATGESDRRAGYGIRREYQEP